jgi:hypothetical protein
MPSAVAVENNISAIAPEGGKSSSEAKRRNPIVKLDEYTDERVFFVKKVVEGKDAEKGTPITVHQLIYNYVLADKIDAEAIANAQKADAKPSFRLRVPEFTAYPCRVGYEKKAAYKGPPKIVDTTTDEEITSWYKQMAMIVRWDRENPEHIKFVAVSEKLYLRTVREFMAEKAWIDHGKSTLFVKQNLPRLVQIPVKENGEEEVEDMEKNPGSMFTFWAAKYEGKDIGTTVIVLDNKGKQTVLSRRKAYDILTRFKIRASAVLGIKRAVWTAGSPCFVQNIDTLFITSVKKMERIDWAAKLAEEEGLRASDEDAEETQRLLAEMDDGHVDSGEHDEDDSSAAAVVTEQPKAVKRERPTEEEEEAEDDGENDGENDENDNDETVEPPPAVVVVEPVVAVAPQAKRRLKLQNTSALNGVI